MLVEERKNKLEWQRKQARRKGSNNNAYVYVHTRKDTDEPFYVGIGWTTTRPWNFRERNRRHKNIARKHGVRTQIVVDEIPLTSAKSWEIQWIKTLRASGFELVNETDGGDSNPMEFEEIREKQKQNVPRGDSHYAKEDAARENLRIKNTGKKYPPEVNAKKGRAGPKLTLTEEGRKTLKLPKRAETRAKMSATALIVQGDPAQRAKNSAGCVAAAAKRTKEEKTAISLKGWETRRRNKLLKEGAK
jgi:predicted type IV restriction endonuclease